MYTIPQSFADCVTCVLHFRVELTALMSAYEAVPIEDWEINCLLSIADEEERQLNAPQPPLTSSSSSSSSLLSNLAWGTRRLAARRRPGSESCSNSQAGRFRASNTDVTSPKRQRVESVGGTTQPPTKRRRSGRPGLCTVQNKAL